MALGLALIAAEVNAVQPAEEGTTTPPGIPLKFDFGSGAPKAGFEKVQPDAVFSTARGYGFEPDSGLVGDNLGVASEHPFYFTATVPGEGNYRVTVTLGGARASVNTVKAELRRLMIEQLRVAAGESVQRSFIVNVRSPRIAALHGVSAGEVRLKAPREITQESWAWDDQLTLEFNGSNPAVSAVTIEPVAVPTLFLVGDSTVCDQSREPYNSWGQMLPRFFSPDIAVANHGESGETYRDSIDRRRLDKIISVMKPGDWLFMQFGHNDQKQIAAGTGGPFTTYKEEMKAHIAAVRRVGGNPVIVSPMERRAFDADGRLVPSLSDYAQAAHEVAGEEQVPIIDLHAMSQRFYLALGPEKSALAFAAPAGKQDNTHHTNYGSYELAKCVAEGIRETLPDLARHLSPDFGGFDPAKPDDIDTFAVPPSPLVTTVRPLGN